MESDHRIMDNLLIIEKSPDVPTNGLAVRQDLDSEVKDILREALLDMHKYPAGRDALRQIGARKFISTSDEDYEPVYGFIREIDLDLHDYDYMKD
jgi:ABC-type phosphate/phosphonate transport system substrate-binding protein